jgi:hypothetical protein
MNAIIAVSLMGSAYAVKMQEDKDTPEQIPTSSPNTMSPKAEEIRQMIIQTLQNHCHAEYLELSEGTTWSLEAKDVGSDIYILMTGLMGLEKIKKGNKIHACSFEKVEEKVKEKFPAVQVRFLKIIQLESPNDPGFIFMWPREAQQEIHNNNLNSQESSRD